MSTLTPTLSTGHFVLRRQTLAGDISYYPQPPSPVSLPDLIETVCKLTKAVDNLVEQRCRGSELANINVAHGIISEGLGELRQLHDQIQSLIGNLQSNLDAQILRLTSDNEVTTADIAKSTVELTTAYYRVLGNLQTTASNLLASEKNSGVSQFAEKKIKNQWEKFHSSFLVSWPEFSEWAGSVAVNGGGLPLQTEIYLKSFLDPFDFDCVTSVDFQKLLQAFGPPELLFSKINSFCSAPYWVGFIKPDLVGPLLHLHDSHYLIRQRGDIQQMALDYSLEGKVHTIEFDLEHGSVIVSTPDCPSPFESVSAFTFYLSSKYSLYAYDFELKRVPSLFENISHRVALNMLSKQAPGTYLAHFSDSPKIESYIELNYVDISQQIITLPITHTAEGYSLQINQTQKTHQSLAQLLASFRELRYVYSDAFGLWPLKYFEPWRPHYQEKKRLFGPEEEDNGCKLHDDDMGVACETTSTYPKIVQGAAILCDAFHVQRVGDRTVAVICDGCAWGSKSRDAAQRASRTFCDYMSSHAVNMSCDDTLSIRKELRNALDAAHKSIFTSQKKNNIGTTTLLGGIFLKYQDGPDWAFASISVGDCKAFRWDCISGKVVDITSGNRLAASDAKDCGGRIGPTIAKKPDMRNLAYCLTDCCVGDIILLISDGIYDNLDPERLGIHPQLLDDKLSPSLSWSELPNDVSSRLKETYSTSVIASLISKSDKSLQSITEGLVTQAKNVTQKSRQFMDENPHMNEPSDFKEWPGKMDHTTCISIQIKPTRKGRGKSPSPDPFLRPLEFSSSGSLKKSPLVTRRTRDSGNTGKGKASLSLFKSAKPIGDTLDPKDVTQSPYWKEFSTSAKNSSSIIAFYLDFVSLKSQGADEQWVYYTRNIDKVINKKLLTELRYYAQDAANAEKYQLSKDVYISEIEAELLAFLNRKYSKFRKRNK